LPPPILQFHHHHRFCNSQLLQLLKPVPAPPRSSPIKDAVAASISPPITTTGIFLSWTAQPLPQAAQAAQAAAAIFF
jgi:hypothetical protein